MPSPRPRKQSDLHTHHICLQVVGSNTRVVDVKERDPCAGVPTSGESLAAVASCCVALSVAACCISLAKLLPKLDHMHFLLLSSCCHLQALATSRGARQALATQALTLVPRGVLVTLLARPSMTLCPAPPALSTRVAAVALEPTPPPATQVCSSPTLLRKALWALQVLISNLLLVPAMTGYS